MVDGEGFEVADLKDIVLTDIIDQEVIQSLQDSFSKAFGIPAIICSERGKPITTPSFFNPLCKQVCSTQKGAAHCSAMGSDIMKRPDRGQTPRVTQSCAIDNMLTGIVPILIEGRHLANWQICQLVESEADKVDMDPIGVSAGQIGIDQEHFAAAGWAYAPIKKEQFYNMLAFLENLTLQIVTLGLKNFQQAQSLIQSKRSEAFLKESQARFRELAELLPVTVYEMDSHGQLVFVSQQFFDDFEYTPQDFEAGLNAFDMIAEVDRERAMQDARDVLAGKSVGMQEYSAKRKDGSVFTVLSSASALVKDGCIIGLRGIMVSVEEQEKLKEHLNWCQKLEALGRLAGGVAHDFNNMLSPIIGYSEMIMDDIPLDDPHRYGLGQIHTAAMRAKDLTLQLLACGCKQTLDMKNIDLNQSVESFVEMLKRTIREDIHFKMVLATDIEQIRADAGQIEKLLTNLAINAQYAMPAGGKIAITTAMVSGDGISSGDHEIPVSGRYTMLMVEDSGYGMDVKTRNQIFEPFFTTKEMARGMGLGLSAVYGIVKQHNAYIHVESAPGKGTVFKIYFPVFKEKPVGNAAQIAGKETLSAAGEKPVVINAQIAGKEAVSGTETVMVVEDNPTVCDLACKILKRSGYHVIEALSPKEALNLAVQYDGVIDLLLTDVIMPEMDGNKLKAKLSSLRPEMKVLFMSGYTNNLISSRDGMTVETNFIQKPFSVYGLLQKVRMVLDG